MFFYDSLSLLCCCAGLIMLLVIGGMLGFFLMSGDRRKERRNKFKQKLEDFKKKNSTKYAKTSKSSTPVAEDAEFRDAK